MGKPLSGGKVLLWLVGFFGIVIAVNVYFISVSSATFRGEDEQKPYLQGVEYNDTLARRARQAGLGWTASIAAARLSNGTVRIDIAVRDRNGRPVTESGLAGELRHPADENRDHVLRFVQAAPGVYQATADQVAPGAWDVVVQSRAATTPFEASRRLWLR